MTRRTGGETYTIQPGEAVGETFEAQAHPDYPEPQAHPVDPAEVAADEAVEALLIPAAETRPVAVGHDMASAPDVGLNILVTADPQPPPGTVAVKPHGWHVHNGVLNQPGHKIHVAPEIAEALVARGRADLA